MTGSDREPTTAVPAPDVSARPLAELLRLDGRRAVVTGAGQGIGAAIAVRLAEAGASVMLGDLALAGVDEVARQLARRYGADTAGAEVDVRDANSVRALVDSAVERIGGVDIWVNNAGVYPAVPVLDMTDDEWDEVLAVNLRGTFLGAREAGRRMVAQGTGGVIVNLASTSAARAAPGFGHYASSKHGVVGLTKSLAVELGPFGIRAVAVAPTVVRTPSVIAAQAQHAADGRPTLEDFAARLPLGRVGEPDDVARCVVVCASDLAALTTGSTIYIDAGYLAG